MFPVPRGPYLRTCWIYNLCGSIRIYKNQISGIDPKYGSIKIFADQCGSILINKDLCRSMRDQPLHRSLLIRIDWNRSAKMFNDSYFRSIPEI